MTVRQNGNNVWRKKKYKNQGSLDKYMTMKRTISRAIKTAKKCLKEQYKEMEHNHTRSTTCTKKLKLAKVILYETDFL